MNEQGSDKPRRLWPGARLIVGDTLADFAIKAGLATEDDLVRIKPMPQKRERA